MSTCSRCGAGFGCAMADGADHPCWCTGLPAAVPVPGQPAACWCPACLEQHIAGLESQQRQTVPDRALPAATSSSRRRFPDPA